MTACGLWTREMVFERLGVAGVERHGAQVSRAVSLDHRFGGGRVDVTQRDVVIPGLGQQPADEGADLAGTQNENFVHEYLVLGGSVP